MEFEDKQQMILVGDDAHIVPRTETIFTARRYVCNGPMKGIGPYEIPR